ncbi:hypothetical protein [Streptomyces sp. NPDC001389]
MAAQVEAAPDRERARGMLVGEWVLALEGVLQESPAAGAELRDL